MDLHNYSDTQLQDVLDLVNEQLNVLRQLLNCVENRCLTLQDEKFRRLQSRPYTTPWPNG